MKIGFYTSTFNDRPLEEVIEFARQAGFEAIELDVRGHIKTPDNVASAVALARDRGLFVSSIALFGNQLDPDPDKRKELRARTHDFAKAVGDANVPIIVIFPGRDNTISEDDNYKSFAEHANALVASTAVSRLEFAIENWPGPKNDFIATTPEGLAEAFRPHSRPAVRARVRPLAPDPARHRPVRGTRRGRGSGEDSPRQGHLD
jgi:sugar phosphate isomerase/epimerase